EPRPFLLRRRARVEQPVETRSRYRAKRRRRLRRGFRRRPPGSDSRARSVASRCCTTRRQNTHGTEVRELLYPWHPWFGRLVHVHEVLVKDEAVFRCSLSGAFSDRLIEVPSWMFDRPLSGCWRVMLVPYARCKA